MWHSVERPQSKYQKNICSFILSLSQGIMSSLQLVWTVTGRLTVSTHYWSQYSTVVTQLPTNCYQFTNPQGFTVFWPCPPRELEPGSPSRQTIGCKKSVGARPYPLDRSRRQTSWTELICTDCKEFKQYHLRLFAKNCGCNTIIILCQILFIKLNVHPVSLTVFSLESFTSRLCDVTSGQSASRRSYRSLGLGKRGWRMDS